MCSIEEGSVDPHLHLGAVDGMYPHRFVDENCCSSAPTELRGARMLLSADLTAPTTSPMLASIAAAELADRPRLQAARDSCLNGNYCLERGSCAICRQVPRFYQPLLNLADFSSAERRFLSS